jgi:hypothetical protein
MNHCIFVHFGHKNHLPFPDFSYVSQLAKLFSRVTVVTNERDFSLGDLSGQVNLKMVKNEGYDCGMFLKVIREIDLTQVDRLALVNDSNLLLGNLEALMKKGEQLGAEFWAAIDSFEKPWYSTHREAYHLQSHFLVWEKRALPMLQDYLREIPLDMIYAAASPKEIRRKVIDLWEIGLSQYFISRGVMPQAVYKAKSLASILGRKETINFTIKAPKELLELEYPFLKKRCIREPSFLQRIFRSGHHWERLITAHAKEEAEAARLVNYYKSANN